MNTWTDKEERILAVSVLYFNCNMSVSHLHMVIIITNKLTALHCSVQPLVSVDSILYY